MLSHLCVRSWWVIFILYAKLYWLWSLIMVSRDLVFQNAFYVILAFFDFKRSIFFCDHTLWTITRLIFLCEIPDIFTAGFLRIFLFVIIRLVVLDLLPKIIRHTFDTFIVYRISSQIMIAWKSNWLVNFIIIIIVSWFDSCFLLLWWHSCLAVRTFQCSIIWRCFRLI